ncbi:hypothetical protein ACOMHN_060804 [Nucella lapillus]
MVRGSASVIGLVIVVCCLPAAEGQSCLNEWTFYEGSCYIIGSELLTWADSEQMCRLMGSDLVVVDTALENNFLKRFLEDHHSTTQSGRTHVWLGATDIFQEGSFLWLNTFQNVTYSHWARGEPNSAYGSDSEDCVQMRREVGWRWNDQSCASLSYFVCEKSPLGGDIIG